jgi:hypothetical protein
MDPVLIGHITYDVAFTGQWYVYADTGAEYVPRFLFVIIGCITLQHAYFVLDVG